ncbi:unnamed protein product [Paramecium primaurelia]|uniref:Uncharacterized protein n=1 Tax=Paramecium primaurelia TaxID=5886 RepID=A0A8S1M027_PARPR|nr:unnamed protein product [Paramecium primaurelia]
MNNYMNQKKLQVEQKSPRLLIFPKQKQNQVNSRAAMNYFTEMKKEHQQINENKQVLPPEFYISLLSLEPKQSQLHNPNIELIRTLIDSYLIITDQLHGQDGLMIYFKDKINSLLEQPQVRQCILKSDDAQLQQMLEKSAQSYCKQSNVEEMEAYMNMNKPQVRNSLATFLTMHDRLEKEYDKAQQILQDYDDHVAQFDELMQKDLDNQKNALEDRLKKRNDIKKRYSGHEQRPNPNNF